jgi:hypothetical protein
MLSETKTNQSHFISIGALVCALAVAGCGDDESGDSKSGAKSAMQSVEAAVPKINEAVPADLRDKLTFAATTEEDDEVAAAVPTGWTSKFMPGSYKPADEDDLGFMTSYSVGSNCDGVCSPKDWAAAVSKVEFAQFAQGSFTIDKDEKLGTNGRLVVARSDDSAYVVAAWWKSDASKYYYCRASLDDDAVNAVGAFEKACRSTRVLAW